MNAPRPGRAATGQRSGAVLRGVLMTLLFAASLFAIARARAIAAASHQQLQSGADVYALPQKEQLLVFSLGYRAALADLLFGRTLVAAGRHFLEKRVFHHLDGYLRAILTLDSRYRDVYLYADTLLNLSTVEMPQENLRIARDILEQGLEEFPSDADLWMNSGLFVAYLAPQRLPDTEDRIEWRGAGARMIGRACDLWPGDKPPPATCFSNARLLQEAGEDEAAIASLERLLAITDHAETRAMAMGKLERLLGERAARSRNEAVQRLSRYHLSDLPSASRTRYQILSPKTDPAQCTGPAVDYRSLACASSFARLSEAHAPSEAAVQGNVPSP